MSPQWVGVLLSFRDGVIAARAVAATANQYEQSSNQPDGAGIDTGEVVDQSQRYQAELRTVRSHASLMNQVAGKFLQPHFLEEARPSRLHPEPSLDPRQYQPFPRPRHPHIEQSPCLLDLRLPILLRLAQSGILVILHIHDVH